MRCKASGRESLLNLSHFVVLGLFDEPAGAIPQNCETTLCQRAYDESASNALVQDSANKAKYYEQESKPDCSDTTNRA